MFSHLVLTINGQEIEFSAYELIMVSKQLITETVATLKKDEVNLPDYHKTEAMLNEKLEDLTAELAVKLALAYSEDPRYKS